jgi:ubiquinone/menaquinone biosynthesis C-methylase UbiE
MKKDPYRNVAKIYDRLFDSMNKGLRLAGLRLFRPKDGMKLLDVGCGTGSHLELYQRYKCHFFGLDLSPSMLRIAREKVRDSAQLTEADAAEMPYDSGKFDLVVSMLSLHEMAPDTRSAVLLEMKRTLKEDGRLLLIDFHPGPYQPLQGWYSKIIIVLSELAAGRDHFKNYRHFMANGGIKALLGQQNLTIENERILAGGTFAVYLAFKQAA